MIIEHKGYVAHVDLDENHEFHGRVMNTRDVINFYGQSAKELQEEFQRSIEAYLADCTEHQESQ